MATETIIQLTEEQLRRVVREEVQQALLSYPNAGRPQPYRLYEPNVAFGGGIDGSSSVGIPCYWAKGGWASHRPPGGGGSGQS